MTYDPQRALELLRLGTQQPHARFRKGQEEAIRHVVDGRGPLLLVQRTGWGKSNVYFIAAKLLREAGQGPGLLISPLLALMRNQIEAAERMGVRAATINSDNRDEWGVVEAQIRRDAIDVLLISPERLANESFVQDVLAPMSDRIALLVIDEAHCISDWGHDFRPDYRRIERIIGTLPPNLRLLGTTATANDRVLRDLEKVLDPPPASLDVEEPPTLEDLFDIADDVFWAAQGGWPSLTVQRGDLNRPSLLLQTIRLPRPAQRLAWLAERLGEVTGSGIIYTLTVRDAEQVAAWLRDQGFKAEAYTGQTEGPLKPKLEQALLDNRVKALAATTALGMGFDKPDLAFVFHYQAPASVIHYYQQVGRAGRALDAAYGVLLSGDEDSDIVDFFIRAAFPTRGEVEEVLGALEQSPVGLSTQELKHRLNLRPDKVEKTLELLSLESPAPIAASDGRWQLAAAELSSKFWQRVRRLTDLRYAEKEQMQEYIDLSSGHMEFLVRALDGDPGVWAKPRLQPLASTVESALVRRATAFVSRGRELPIHPRDQWPAGGKLQSQDDRTIPLVRRASPGRALSQWGDAGWWNRVREGKYGHERFADDLVNACERLLREWNPTPAPMWVTAIPSVRRPKLVPDFAQRLASAAGLPYHDVLKRARQHQEQKLMENSYMQALNVYESLDVRGRPPAGPVLLVDDIVDSRWTMTVAAYKLRSSGSGEVFPLALSLAGGGA